MPYIEPASTEGRNYEQAFSHRPELAAIWDSMNGAIKARMDLRRYELATVAAAKTLGSSYCTLAHGSVLADDYLGPDLVQALVEDHHTAGLSELDVAVMDLAEKVARDAAGIVPADIERLRSHGLGDDEIFDVVAAAAARSFFTKVVDGLGFEPDASYNALEPGFRAALTVGKPIAT